jgi:chromosome segregation ATPase
MMIKESEAKLTRKNHELNEKIGMLEAELRAKDNEVFSYQKQATEIVSSKQFLDTTIESLKNQVKQLQN